MGAEVICHSALRTILIDSSRRACEFNARIQAAYHNYANQNTPSPSRTLLSDLQESPRQNWQPKCEKNQAVSRKDDRLLMGQIRHHQQTQECKEQDQRWQNQLRFF